MGKMTAGARYVYHHDVFVRLSIFLLSQLLLNFLLLLVDNIVCSFGEGFRCRVINRRPRLVSGLLRLTSLRKHPLLDGLGL